MREIKFKGLRTDGKGWVKGYLSRIEDVTTWVIVDWDNKTFYHVIPESVGQFTGLKDKNNKEIYIGDVLQTPTGIATVVWQDIAVALKIPGSEDVDWEHSSYYAKCEIIGNIHENPDLQ